MSKIFGHRGFSGEYPENTMLSFKKAIEAGVDGIELDVHLTADGELVIIHDENIRRTSNGEGEIKDMTLSELRQYDYSAAYQGVYGKNDIPTLREYLEAAKEAGIITNIELKTGIYDYPGIEKKVIDTVREFGLEDKIILSSFNHFTIMRCREIAPEIKTGFLSESWLIGYGSYTEANGVDCCHPICCSLDEEVINEMHSHGREINTWTVNEPEDILRLSGLGVEGLIGNYPDRMVKLLRK